MSSLGFVGILSSHSFDTSSFMAPAFDTVSSNEVLVGIEFAH